MRQTMNERNALHGHEAQTIAQASWRRRALATAATIACLAGLLWGYDALGFQRAAMFETENQGDPVSILKRWQSYQTWHPTRRLFGLDSTLDEERHLANLGMRARESEFLVQLAALRRLAGDPDSDADAAWQDWHALRAAYPEMVAGTELQSLGGILRVRREDQLTHRSQRAYDLLLKAEQDGVDLSILLAHTEQFLHDHAGSRLEDEVRHRRSAYLARLEERDIEAARNYSARYPFLFQARREQYQRYLDKHPTGAFAAEAAGALKTIEADWDKHDFRALRDHFLDNPGAIAELVTHCRTYQAAHPQGRFATPVTDLLRWSERVTAPREYRVILRNGWFEKRLARFFSRGPDLSVEIEVAGVRYGPSNIVVNQYEPEWNYEFPRRIRWKLGDPVRIRVTDHDYWDRVMVDILSGDGDPLAMQLLSGDAWCGKNRVTFESDFTMPNLPKIE
jgi:hypothetical protein